jgi:NodT family efflux transporter outer membrane factor (OMF) lipoprotein
MFFAPFADKPRAGQPQKCASRSAHRLPTAWPAIAVLLAGCTVGPNYRTPVIAMPKDFPDPIAAIADVVSAAAPTKMEQPHKRRPVEEPVDLTVWWRSLNDPQLNSLVERAIEGNLDLAVALQRLQEARTQEDVVLGTALPSGAAEGAIAKGTGTDLARGRVSPLLISATNTTAITQINEIAGFEAGWELDMFGLYRRELEAATYDTEATLAARNATMVSVVGDVVRAYVDLRGLQTQLAILHQEIATQNHSVQVVQERFNRGLTNELDVALAKRELATLQATVAPLAAQVRAAEYTIDLLIGDMPGTLEAELSRPEMIPSLPEKIVPGLPLELLKRRPDIEEAEREVAAATARIGVATANLYPHLVITAAGGGQGQGLGVSPNLAKAIWSAGPGVYWSVLDFGTLDALVEVADYRTKEQLAAYKAAILTAVQQVDVAINDYAAQQQRLRSLETALAAAEQSVSLASQRYDRGLTDFLNVLDAQREDYALEDQYTRAQQTAADDFAALYKALGGGWEKYQAIPPIRRPKPAIVAAFERSFENPPSPSLPVP